MKKLIILLVGLVSINASADFEAGTPRAERVAKNIGIKAITQALSKQDLAGPIGCYLETLPSNVSGPKVLVDFYEEDGISKFTVTVKCGENESTGELNYDVKGRIGDAAILVESIKMN